MSGPDHPDEPSAMARALQAAQENAQLRLRRAAERLAVAAPADGVLFSALWRRPGLRPVTVILLWPGWMLEVDPGGGEIIAETHVTDMHTKRPGAAAFLAGSKAGKPLLSALYLVPQAGRHMASMDASGVVQVRDAATRELLAESEPGQPGVLRAGFHALTPQDLAPRIS